MKTTSIIQFILPDTIFDGFTMSVSLSRNLQIGDVIDWSEHIGLENIGDATYRKALSKIQWEVSSITYNPYKIFLKPTNLDSKGNLVYADVQ